MVFNGDGKEYKGFVIHEDSTKIQISDFIREGKQPKKKIILAQCVSSSRHMDFSIQKSVELGIHVIIPIISRRSHPGNHMKKIPHWEKTIIHAVEQSNGLFIPKIFESISFNQLLKLPLIQNNHKILFHHSGRKMVDGDCAYNEIIILIGSEGGFSSNEIEDARRENWNIISLGERILRTETAAIVAHTLLKGY